VGDQNSTFEAASSGIMSILQQKSRNSWKDFSEQLSGANFSSEVRIENFETSDVRPAGISDSYYSLNSSEVRKLCNISNPTSDGVEVQEAHDQVHTQQQIFQFCMYLIFNMMHIFTLLQLNKSTFMTTVLLHVVD
jgi:hypothetical protein